MRKSMMSLAIAAALASSALAAPHTIEAPARVMVLPFRPIGDVGSYGWIGDGVEQSLIVRASQPGATVLTAPPQNLNLNAKVDPVTVAKAAGASSVVAGSFQILNNEVKFDGQILDVTSGQSIGSLSVTGPVRDLFKLEDELSHQLDHVLPKAAADSGEVVPQPMAGTVVSYQPVYVPTAGSYYSTPDDSYYPRYYSPAYSDLGYYNYGYDNYGYLPFYSGFYFGGGFGYGYHDGRGHYHGWDGHHFADRGATLGHTYNHGGSGFEHGASYDHGGNYHGGVATGGRGFAPVGTIVGGRSYNYSNGGVVAGNRGFAVSHGGYQAPPNFSSHNNGGNFMGPTVSHGIGTPGAAMGSSGPGGGSSFGSGGSGFSTGGGGGHAGGGGGGAGGAGVGGHH